MSGKNSAPTQVAEAPVTAALLIIGNEILSGRTQDLNLNYIAKTLGSWGVQLKEARIVPDIAKEIISAINVLRERFDYVFTTGGIGPTHDDITADCIARAFNVPLIEHPDIAAVIRRRDAPPDIMANRLLMARVPDGAGLIDNPTGGPQGFTLDNVYVLAGIPRVMQAMLGSLEGKVKGGPLVHSRSVTAYLGESSIATQLAALQDDNPTLDLGSYPFTRDGRYGTTLVVRGTDTQALEQVIEALRSIIIAAGETPVDDHR